jgi:hypothetical protein
LTPENQPPQHRMDGDSLRTNATQDLDFSVISVRRMEFLRTTPVAGGYSSFHSRFLASFADTLLVTKKARFTSNRV